MSKLAPLQTVQIPPDLSPESISALIEEINYGNTVLYEALSGLYGSESNPATLTGDLDLDGNRIHNHGSSTSAGDLCPRGELVERALYAAENKHTAAFPIIATKGVFLDTTRVREPDEAISKAEVDRLVNAMGSGIITDHGALSGLSDDDHPQYMLDADFTGANVLALLLTVDGAGSGLDADLLDGMSSAAFAAAAHTHAWADITGEPTTLAGYGINDAAGILAQLITVDGGGSGLDADLLDGLSSAAFALASHAHSAADITSGTLPITRGGTGNTTGTATINANLTGPITSVGNATAVAAQTGTGSTFAMQTSPAFTTPNIGAASGTSLSVTGSLTLATNNSSKLVGTTAAGTNESSFFVNASNEWELRQNVGGALNATYKWGAGAFYPGAGEDLGLTGTRWGAGYFSGQVNAATLLASGLTSGRVPFVTTGGLITDDADLTFATDTLTATKMETTALGATTPGTGKFTTLQRRAGTSTGYGGSSTTLSSQTTVVGNVGAGTDDLMTYTLPANALATNGDWVRITATFYAAANATNKSFRLELNLSNLWQSGTQAFNNAHIAVTVLIVRTGANAQRVTYQAISSSALLAGLNLVSAAGALTETDTSAMTIKGTGLSGSSTTDDCQQYCMLIEYGSLS